MNEYNQGISIVSPQPKREQKQSAPKPQKVQPSEDELREQLQGGL